MKTQIAAFALLLTAGTAPAAFAQDQDHHERGAGEQRPAGVPHEHHGGPAGQWGGGAPRPQAQAPATPPAAPQAQPAPQPRAPGGPWGGRGGGQHPDFQRPDFRRPDAQRPTPPPGGPAAQPRGDHRPGGEDGQRYVRHPGTWVDRDGDPRGAGPVSPNDRADREDRDEVRQWQRFHNDPAVTGGRPQGERQGDRRGDGRRDDGDHRDDHRGDHRGDHRDDHRGDRWDNHGRPQWRPGAYPHSFNSAHRFHWRPYLRPPHFYAHVWTFGEFLPPAWYGPEYVIDDWWDFDLPPPPPGYVWVRVGDDALLIDGYDGRVVQVVRALFW